MELHYHAFSGKPFVALIVALFNYGVRAVFTQQFEGTKGAPPPPLPSVNLEATTVLGQKNLEFLFFDSQASSAKGEACEISHGTLYLVYGLWES